MNQGTILVPIVMFGWIPVVLLIFALFPPRRAVIAAFLTAWLFLPPLADYHIEGLPAYTKMNATCLGVLLAAAIFDRRTLLALIPRWFDLPMALWCLCPFFSALVNGRGIYDALSALMYQTFMWGLPYLIGRAYFTTLTDVRELAIGIFIGGIIYVPLCLWEIRMSPQLHEKLYGYLQQDWSTSKRWGGWRPQVFMANGLMVGMWMCMTALIALGLWWSRAAQRLWGLPTLGLTLMLAATAVLCKSSGAIALLSAGACVLALGRVLRSPLPLWCLLAAAPLYVGVRLSGGWSQESIVSVTKVVTEDPERIHSLSARLENEDALAAKALAEHPLFGAAKGGDWRVTNEAGVDVTASDGLWVIALGQFGLLGLCAMMASLLVPTALLLAKMQGLNGGWRVADTGAPIILAIVCVLYALDCLPNAMVNPIFTIAAAAVANAAWQIGAQRKARAAKHPSFPRRAHVASTTTRARRGA